MNELLVRLGERVRQLRQEQAMTRAALAERSSLSVRFLSDLEAGRANISVLKLAQVAQALGVQAASLIDHGGRPGVIALLGLRGAGKSTIGRKLAQRMSLPFFELDRLVEAEAGMSLPEIFSIHGEEYFRRQELAALQRFLAEHERAVLATGGGLVASPDAYRLLLDRTFTIWLKATPGEHWHRVVEQGDLRPMENRPHAMAELRRRLREREPLYARARLALPTSGRGVDAIVTELKHTLG